MQECSIGKPINRIDVPDKIAGKVKYIADYKFDGMLYAKTLRSTEVRAKIKNIKYPKLPKGYYIIDKDDVPEKNRVKVFLDDQPFFAEDAVNYYGEPIALVVGPDKNEILNILNKTVVEYEKIETINDMDEALEKKLPIYGDDNIFAEYCYSKGDINKCSFESNLIIEGEYRTGYQEQLYLEPQGAIGMYKDGKITIYGSMQCPYYVKGAVVDCLGVNEDKVQIIQTTTGGAFGGKEDFPSLLAGQIACAAMKTNKPVQIVLDRDEDVEYTPKRHPSRIKLKSYINKDYKIIGMEADIRLDAGAYSGLSPVVLQRAMFSITGAYNIQNVMVKGMTVATNNVVSGGFRGFGGPQAQFALEMHMEHIANKLGIESVELKKKNFLKQGDMSSTGGIFRDKIILHEMLERAMDISLYKEKRKKFKEEKTRGKLKGIGLSVFFHGNGFTGSEERDSIKSKVKLIKNKGETVEILVSSVEMGQGARTTLRKIVSCAASIPIEKVVYKNPDTNRVPDSGPTVASRTVMIVGKLLKEAAEELKDKWNESDYFEIEKNYKYPEGFKWDKEHFKGDAYTSYSWGVNVVEVELDSITYEPSIKGVWAVFDIGKAIDERIVKGQIDGGILQGLGYAGIEVMESSNGRIMQRTITDYTIPTSNDAPKIVSELMNVPCEYGPYGAKGIGEITHVGSPVAYALAVENAIGNHVFELPVRPEDLMEVNCNE